MLRAMAPKGPPADAIPLSTRARTKEPEDAKSMLVEIDGQISAYRGKLYDLTVKRNTLLPITQLPPEILSQIFRICTDMADSNAWEQGEGSSVAELSYIISGCSSHRHEHSRMALNLSHVCHTWRAIARNDALLWTHLPTYSEELCKRMLVRSKKAPLTVRSFVDRDIAALRLALSDVSRIKLLHLSRGSSPNVPRNLFDFLMIPAPALEKLLLFNTAPYTGPAAAMETMPTNIFGGVVPRLSELVIYEGPQLSWTSPLLKSPVLTKLQVGGMINWRSAPLEELLKLLDSMPQLEILSLSHSIPLHVPLPGRFVKMPRLRKISLSDSHDRCLSLLECLSLSPTTAVDIRSSLANVPSIRTNLVSTFQQTKQFFKGVKAVAFDIPTQRVFSKIQLRCWTTDIPDGDVWDPTNCSSLKIQFNFAWPRGAELDPVVIALDACSIVSFTAIDTIAIGVHESAPADLCRNLFHRFIDARTVCLSGSTLNTMLNTLLNTYAPTPVPEGEGTPQRVAFPNVRTLILDTARIRTADLDRLKSYFAARTELTLLKLKMCMVRKSLVKKLEELVPEVVWDGRRVDRQNLLHPSFGVLDGDVSVDEDGDNTVLLPTHASTLGGYDDEP
ncbi:hypothetical protein EVG20_g3129 [Dentipellis fragilis]|uniref:F-box domain-containing protein n=1 Tax=Dentipellis fragilis TaxID=205917 RepID=A0A4Y9Z4C0_9AGAM|nr:hypothetical protein EVG20_g3129 [Dentipellis fragilis]